MGDGAGRATCSRAGDSESGADGMGRVTGWRMAPVLIGLAMALSGCQAPATPLAEPVPVNGVGYIIINTAIAPASRDFFITNANKLRAAGAKEIDLGINSPGGTIGPAQEMADYMERAHQANGVTFKVYNLGLVASAATFVFLNAQERYTSAKGLFLFHAAGMVANGAVSSEGLREAATTIEAYERKIQAALLARTHLTAGEAQTYIHRTVVLNADDARRDGVVDGIADLTLPAGARGYMISSRPKAQAASGRAAAETPVNGR